MNLEAFLNAHDKTIEALFTLLWLMAMPAAIAWEAYTFRRRK